MSKNWWYVEGSDRKGPVEENELRSLLDTGILKEDGFIWTKGFENWIKLNEVSELSHLLGSAEEIPSPEVSRKPAIEKPGLDLKSIDLNERIFYIKTGLDRSKNELGAEYGPFSIDQLKRLFEENRINEKTYIFTTGMDNWTIVVDFELFGIISGGKIVEIEDDERRAHLRKPFVANMYFHDESQLFEGVCRDISIGGLQVLVSNFPGQVNDEVTMNVHPENSDFSFVATGKIVRILDGNSGFSLRFHSIGDEAKSAISTYLQGS
jgi:hypothetical protein